MHVYEQIKTVCPFPVDRVLYDTVFDWVRLVVMRNERFFSEYLEGAHGIVFQGGLLGKFATFV